jgi:hypothetical protein
LLHIEENHTWTIHEIEALTEDEARALSLETVSIKGHTVYLVDLGGYFKYSALVFHSGRHIYYANQYELHFNGYNREALRSRFIEILNSKLFTDEEITGPLHSYTEYTNKAYFIRNYYPMRKEYISNFFIGPESERLKILKKTETMLFSPLAMAWFDPKEKPFVDHMHALHKSLAEKRNAMETDPEYLKNAILHEMYNHEYGINWQGNWDVLSCFGTIRFNESDNPVPYFDQLKWTDSQRAAFWAARAQYNKEQREREERAETA